MNWRGRYEGGGWTVTARHWWSPKERKAARLAAKVLAYKAEGLEMAVRRRVTHRMLFGLDDLMDVYEADPMAFRWKP